MSSQTWLPKNKQGMGLRLGGCWCGWGRFRYSRRFAGSLVAAFGVVLTYEYKRCRVEGLETL